MKMPSTLSRVFSGLKSSYSLANDYATLSGWVWGSAYNPNTQTGWGLVPIILTLGS